MQRDKMSDGELFSQIFWLCTILLQKTAKKKRKKKKVQKSVINLHSLKL